DQFAAVLGLPTLAVSTLKTAQATFMAAWNEYAIQEKSPSVNAGKQDLVDARKGAIRDFQNQHIRFNKDQTNEMATQGC
ncbi:hypothetical protein LQZ19_16265, partial [Treponema primitia]|uniref:hypothetical protein n=1 Tax=Treponema primitia TaxID=88058 RepID=UPI00398177E8